MLHLEEEKRKVFRKMEKSLLDCDWENVKELFYEFGVTYFYDEGMEYFVYIESSVFHYLVSYKKTSLVKIMLENGWNVNEEDEEEETALWFAIYEGGKKMLELLIKYGLNINHRNIRGETGLMMAWNEDKMKEFEVLYQNGADVNICDWDGESLFDNFNFESKMGRKWLNIFLQEPERLNEKNLKIVKSERLKMLYN